jgi:hypothetical protein
MKRKEISDTRVASLVMGGFCSGDGWLGDLLEDLVDEQ